MNASSAASAVHRPGRGRVFNSIVDAIGDTPIVRLRRLPQQHGCPVPNLQVGLQTGRVATCNSGSGALLLHMAALASRRHRDCDTAKYPREVADVLGFCWCVHRNRVRLDHRSSSP